MDEVSAELLKLGGEESVRWLKAIADCIWREESVPRDWRKQLLIPHTHTHTHTHKHMHTACAHMHTHTHTPPHSHTHTTGVVITLSTLPPPLLSLTLPRLDRLASGVLVIARSAEKAALFHKHLRQDFIEKEYIARVKVW